MQRDYSDYVYLDWAATAPLCEAASLAMLPYMQPGQASLLCNMNANSLHGPGRDAFAAMQDARKRIAHDIGASRPSEIIFTSGATEADNAALFGIAHAALKKHPRRNESGFKPYVVTSAIEHEAVLAACERLAQQGFGVIKLKPSRDGLIDPDEFERAVGQISDGAVVLVSIQMANGELGTIQPVGELADRAHRIEALFHADATQLLGKLPVDVGELGVDAASFSAHKIGGPKGIGALYLKARTPFEPMLVGGGQEDARRSTTQNVAGMAGFAAALDYAVAHVADESVRQAALRDELRSALSLLPGVRLTVGGSAAADADGDMCREDGVVPAFLPNIVHVLVHGIESETLILRLDERGFGVSGGSACSSRSLDPSHVLTAIGIPADDAYGALRVSIGELTTRRDIQKFVQAFTDCISAA